jgi:cobalt-zinc-cadmium efflux system membrane fusion protein
MQMAVPTRSALAAVLVLLGAAGCTKHPIATSNGAGDPPAGEVWMTEQQVLEAKIKVDALAEQDVDDVIATSGKVTFDDARVSHIFSPVSGRVSRINAQAGQRVKKGDVLAVLESPEIGMASADVHKAEADRIAAEHDLGRQKELLASHATSIHDFEQAEDAARKAKAEVERATQKATLLRAGSSDVVSQTYSVRATIDGQVTARNISPGVEVVGQYAGGTAVELFTVGELDRVWILADVYEMDSARVVVGSKVNAHVFAFPNRTFATSIEWVSGTLDPSTRTSKVRCVLENGDRALKPEMYATLFISVDQRKSLAIPRSALLRLGEQTVVFVEKGKRPDGRHVYLKVPVVVDEAESASWIPVSKGLAKGDQIVTAGGILLAGSIPSGPAEAPK